MNENLDTTRFFVIGNNLSLDFINTEVMVNGERKDLLVQPEDFMAWAVTTALLEPQQASRLLVAWREQPEVEEFLAASRSFRQILRQMVEGITHGEAVQPASVIAINALLRDQTGSAELRPTATGFERLFHTAYREPIQVLTPIAEAAVALLCYGNLSYLKKCENPSCILYFYDTTKNHSRRWCSMTACGNRAKVAAYYQRRASKERSQVVGG